ncbi:hypothetical protein PR048_014025 [Dryococelus australis]|uniref:Uncharacterized protein n=1 Tax=Dryococelus australis TaxID=614101 RepID=A0ABQ9HTT5_9NEOP|nr:hypothetical protein PR048_014025 [Dryococelus australis]
MEHHAHSRSIQLVAAATGIPGYVCMTKWSLLPNFTCYSMCSVVVVTILMIRTRLQRNQRLFRNFEGNIQNSGHVYCVPRSLWHIFCTLYVDVIFRLHMEEETTAVNIVFTVSNDLAVDYTLSPATYPKAFSTNSNQRNAVTNAYFLLNTTCSDHASQLFKNKSPGFDNSLQVWLYKNKNWSTN